MTIVLTMGTFDTLHPGHVYLFDQCRKIAGDLGEVHVTVNTDRFVKEYKQRPPIQDENERRIMIDALRSVDATYLLDQQDAKPIIEQVNPDFIIIGMDWAPPKDYHAQIQVTAEWLLSQGIAILYLDRLGEYSSSNLKEVIRGS